MEKLILDEIKRARIWYDQFRKPFEGRAKIISEPHLNLWESEQKAIVIPVEFADGKRNLEIRFESEHFDFLESINVGDYIHVKGFITKKDDRMIATHAYRLTEETIYKISV